MRRVLGGGEGGGGRGRREGGGCCGEGVKTVLKLAPNRRRKDGVREAGKCGNTGMREGRRKGGQEGGKGARD